MSEKMAEAREQSRDIMQTTVEEARKEAERLREEKLQQVEQEKETLLRDNTHVTDALIDDICRIVLETENKI